MPLPGSPCSHRGTAQHVSTFTRARRVRALLPRLLVATVVAQSRVSRNSILELRCKGSRHKRTAGRNVRSNLRRLL
jgi:hypothetical protein